MPGTNGIGFYLDVSKFMERKTNNIFVIKRGVPKPSRGTFIRVTVAESEEVRTAEPTGNYNSFYVGDKSNNLGYKNSTLVRYNYISNWERLDAGSILKKDYRFQDLRDRFSDYITGAFIAPQDELEGIEVCMSMYCASTPAFVCQKGGVDTSIFGKTRQWASFNRSTNFIRSEFRRSSSPYFYKALKKKERPDISKCIEVNRAYNNSQKDPVLLPMILPNEFEPVPFFRDKNLCYKPYVQAFMLDMLHIDPVISPSLEKYVEDCVYELINDIIGYKITPYNQDIGSIVSKLPVALARTKLESQASKEDIDKSLAAWSDMFYLSEQVLDSNLDPEQFYQLSPEARTLYLEIKERQDTGQSMQVVDIRDVSKVLSLNFDDALENLILKGMIFRPNLYEVKLVNLKD